MYYYTRRTLYICEYVRMSVHMIYALVNMMKLANAHYILMNHQLATPRTDHKCLTTITRVPTPFYYCSYCCS